MFSLSSLTLVVGQQRRKENDPKKEEEDTSLMSSRMALNDHKAGMQNLDRGKINQIIYEASKGSKFFENEKKKDEQVNQRIAEQQKKIAKITEFELAAAEKEADVIMQNLEKLRDLKRTIVHIDMDAFYAAVETRENPSLQHKPMAVGSNSMLSTSNYIARRFGVRAAMPGFIAKKLCPQLSIIPPDFKKYTTVSRQVRSILVKYDENFCPLSLDEAYLDLTYHLQIRKHLPEEKRTVICWTCENLDTTYCLCDPNLPRQVQVLEPCHEIPSNAKSSSESLVSCRDKSSGIDDNNAQAEQKTAAPALDKDSLDGKTEKNLCSSCRRPFPAYKSLVFGLSAEDAVQEIRCRIEQRTQLTASAGIAPNTLLAKISSDQNKPNGQFSIPYSREAIMEFMRDLPIRKVCGIGKVTEKMLRALDVVTCSHLYKQRGLLNILYSEASLEHFMRVSLGIGSTRVERDSDRKSLSNEQTFTEISKPSELYEKCLQLSDALASDLNNEGLTGRTISVKLKTVDFDVKTRSQTLLQHTADTEMIYQVASDLIKTEITACSPKPFRLRLMGVRISNLLPKTQCKKLDTIDCFIKKNFPAPNNVSSQPDMTSLPTEQIQTISTDLAGSNPQSESKPFPGSPAGHYCPICNRKCPTDLRLFNAHIDKCLLSGENSRSSRKRLSSSLNKDSLTESTSQSSTPLKPGKQRRGRPSKKTAEITLDMVSLQESFTARSASGDQGENMAAMDVAVTSSNEVNPPQEFGIPTSPVFAKSSEFKLPIPETEEIGEGACTETREIREGACTETEEIREGACTETRQTTFLGIGADSAETFATFPCSMSGSCIDKDQQSISSNEMNSTLSLNSTGNPSVCVENLSPADLKTKSSIENDENYSKDAFPINEPGKVSKSETNILLPLKNLENPSDSGLSGEPINRRIDENSAREKSLILEPLRVPESASKEEVQEVKLSPQAKVLSVPALSLKDQNKKKWLQMLQMCAGNAAEVDSENSATFLEEQSTEMKKTKTRPDLISPSKKKPSSKHVSAGKEKSKSVRSLLQYFHPTGPKPCDQTFEQNSDPVQQTDFIEIKTEALSPESPKKSFHIPKMFTPPLCSTKEENTPPLPTDQVLSHNNCDSSENSSNKICPLECDAIVLSKDELKCYQPEIVTFSETDQTQLNHYESQSNQTNVDSKVMVKCEQLKMTTLSTSPLSHDELTADSYDGKPQLDSTASLSSNKFTANLMQPNYASPSYEEADESESSSQENFSQPFQAPSCEAADEESTCLSEKEAETSLQNVESPNCTESREDANVFDDIFTCPVCSKEVTASDMTVFNEHVDLCLNQGIIHNILIEQGEELSKTETMKRRADLLSPLLKTNKKKKYKIGTNSSKDHKMLTLDSFFSCAHPSL